VRSPVLLLCSFFHVYLLVRFSSSYEIYKERYETFEDPQIPAFHYGSHYSSAGIALHYLLRLEPFTSLAVTLQGGRFDLPDRLFDSIHGAWELSLNNVADVKELIPEFFYLPDFLRNVNHLQLGTKQDHSRLVRMTRPTAQPYDNVYQNAIHRVSCNTRADIMSIIRCV
jgi:hypothetical protein